MWFHIHDSAHHIEPCDDGIMQNLGRCRFAFISCVNYFALGPISPDRWRLGQSCHLFKCCTTKVAHRKASCICICYVTPHNRTGAVIVCWCVHSVHTTACCQISNFLWVCQHSISLASPVCACCPCPNMLPFPYTYLRQNVPHMSFHFFLCSVLILAAPHTQKRTGAERKLPLLLRPPPLWKGRAGKEGGEVRQRGEGNTLQTELCLTSLLPERRKDWYKARLNRIERGKRAGQGE